MPFIGTCGKKYCWSRQATDDSITRRVRIAYWVAKATDKHSEYVVSIAFPQQRRLRELAILLRHAYIDCLVYVVGVQEEATKSKIHSHYIPKIVL